MKIKLTDRTADSLAAPNKGDRYYRDEGCPGLALRVGATGFRSWIIEYHLQGQRRRFVIGPRAHYTVQNARDKAHELLKALRETGEDPRTAQAARARAVAEREGALTFAQLYEQWHEAVGKKKKSEANDRSARLKFTAIEDKKAGEITRKDIKGIFDGLSSTPIAANRALALLKTVFRWGVDEELVASDPTKGIKKNPEVERIVPPPPRSELDKFYAALAAHPDQAGANAIKLLFWTGSREREVLWAKWDQLDLERGTFHKRDTKAGPVIIPLDPLTLALLREMKRTATSECLFPGRIKGKPRWDVRKVWGAVKTAINRNKMRPHDLRHWFGTELLNLGVPKDHIAPLMGHHSSQITGRYAHLSFETMKAERERLTLAIAPPPKRIAPVAPKRAARRKAAVR